MSTSITLYLSLALTLASVVLLYLANARVALTGSDNDHGRWRALALAPVRAWQLGARALPIGWVAMVVLYALLQVSAHWGAA